MKRKAVSGIMLILPLLVSILTLTVNIQTATASLPVHNIDTGEDFATIQGAIDDSDTLDGHTIEVETGTYYENILVNKAVLLVGEDRDNTIIDGMGTGTTPESPTPFVSSGIVVITSSFVTLSGFTIQNGGSEDWESIILVYQTTNNIIVDNKIRDYDMGILLHNSSWNTMDNNIIASGRYTSPLDEITGIGLYEKCYYNNVSDNIISENTWSIDIWEGHGNTISNNLIFASTWGIIEFLSESDIVECNNITDVQDGITDVLSNRTRIIGNNVFDPEQYGIYLDGEGATVAENNVSLAIWGIGLSTHATGNIVITNSVSNCLTGCLAWHNSGNIIYHNNFIDNINQVDSVESINTWENGYPSGGNYWSDYTTRYPDAQELDDSGIWDTPYVIDENNQDNYPLMERWTPPPPVPTTISELKVEIEKCWSEEEIDNQGVVKSLIAKLNVAQRLVDKGKIDEAKSILEDDFIRQVQNLAGTRITPKAADILMESAEYIISHL